MPLIKYMAGAGTRIIRRSDRPGIHRAHAQLVQVTAVADAADLIYHAVRSRIGCKSIQQPVTN